jgi:hypothetical protein
MEGTRHEKATIVGVSYFIGALTAFIGFGLNQADFLSTNFTNVQTASVFSALNNKAETNEENMVSYHHGVLEFFDAAGPKVISFNPETSGYTSAPEFELQGVHIGELIFKASKGEEYVFFCEQKSVTSAACSPFVYDVLGDSIYALQYEGQPLAMDINQAETITWNGNELVVDGYIAKNKANPWVLSR